MDEILKKTTGMSRSNKLKKKPDEKITDSSKRDREKKLDGETTVINTIAAMPDPDRVLAERLHAIIKTGFPDLTPRLWYGMPAYAKGGVVLCFFQSAAKFKTRYATLGFMHPANLDDGAMWPTAFALKEITDFEEVRIIDLIKKAMS